MVECSRYYFIDLYRKNLSIYLFENKELTLEEYTPVQDCMLHRIYIPTFKEGERYIGSLNSEVFVSYLYYDPYFVEYNYNNDFEKDGFYYDAHKKVKIYGSTGIYAIRRDDQFYEVITGMEIMDMDAHRIQEVKYVDDFQKMRRDLACVVDHCSLYESILQDFYGKMSTNYANYVNAQKRYEEMYVEYRRRSEEITRLFQLHKDLIRLEKERDLLFEEKKKVQKLILDIQKSS